MAACARDPTEDDAVAGVDATCKGAHCKVAGTYVHGGASKDEAKDGNEFGHSDVPSPLIHSTYSAVSIMASCVGFSKPTRVGSPCNAYNSRDDIRRTSQSKSDIPTKAQRAHDGWEKVLEIAGGHMKMLHEDENPEPRVPAGVDEASPSCRVGFDLHRVGRDSRVG